ncbi:MAG: hypothetical protein OSB83_16255 [Planctomycetota bacterium]|nr:hypothetical protein [Planctomycetota bacterium]
MELRLFFEDYFNAEPEGDDEYSIPTIEQTIPNPDDEALRDALFQVAEKSALDPTVILVHSNSRDFVQFFPLVNPLDKEEEAEPLMDAEIEGGGESAEPSAPPAPGGDEDLAGEEDEALRQLPEDLCHVEYCKHLPGKHHAQFFTEKLTLPEVLEILQLFVAGDESWQKRKEWRKLVWAGPEAQGDSRSKFGSLALAAVFLVGCLATPILYARIMFLLFVAILVFNAYRRIGYGTGSPWKSGDDARWDFYDDGKAAKKKWKPPSGKEVGAFFKEYAGLLIFLAISAFFIVFGIMSGSCRNGFNRKEREPARIERDRGREMGPKAPGEGAPQGGRNPR